MRCSWLLMMICVLGTCSRAWGQEPPPRTLPPTLESFVEAEYPAEALAAGRDGVVELTLTIDELGRVTDAVVATEPGLGLGIAAQAAARRFVFKPATVEGRPVLSRIRYRYAFALPQAPVEQPSFGELHGRVTDQQGRSLPAVDVSLLGGDGLRLATTSDLQGSFVFGELPAGAYTLNLRTLGHLPLEVPERLVAGERLDARYVLQPEAKGSEADFSATGRVEQQVHEVVRRSIKREDLVRMAGTRGDPLRTIELLPGVARPPEGQGMVLVRGSSPGDSQVFMNGAPVHNLYHFGGLTSVANGFLLSGIDLYPGNFSARYGRKMGAVIETGLRDPRSDGLHGVLDVNTIDASLLVETPLSKKVSLALAGRRSYIDTYLPAIMNGADIELVSAPVYYDYQAILAVNASARDKLRLLGYGSFDELVVGLDAQNEHDPAEHGRFSDRNAHHRVQGEWQRLWSERVTSDLMVAVGPTQFQQRLGSVFGYKVEGFDVISRGELKMRLSSRFKLNVGLDLQAVALHLRYNGPRAQQSEGDPSAAGPLAGRDSNSLDTNRHYLRPALYAELITQVTEQLEVTAGVRADYFGEIEQLAADPRLNARLVLGSTTLRAGTGLFSQPPDYFETIPGFSDPKLKASRAVHYGLGAEQSFGKYGMLSLDGFYKQLAKLVVNGGEPGDLSNRGKGRIYGLEVMGRAQPVGRFSGYLAYTLSRSERNDGNGTGYRLFDYDQTHILTASGNVKLGKGWLLGSTFRLGSGNPNTPIVGAIYDASLDVYQPRYGSVNSARSPTFHRLDLRVEKKWSVSRGSLTAYLDVQNVYNHRNAEGDRYSFDYARHSHAPGLPILPSIGLRGEL